MSYGDLFEQLMRSLARVRALDGIPIVRDLYAVEVDDASRALKWLILHPDHVAGGVPVEVMEDINARWAEVSVPAVTP